MDFSFIHAADLHLDSPQKGLESYPDAPVSQIRGATRRALENLVELAIEERVCLVLLAGDLYDGPWRDYNTGLFFTQCMGRLGEAGVRVFLVAGNHDAGSAITRSLRLPENVYLFPSRAPASVRLPEWGLILHGQSYPARDIREDLAASYPPSEPGWFNIGLLHTGLNGRAGHEPYAPTSLEILRNKGYQYWALGHVHQREVICREPWVVFPGNPQGRHIRETGAKGCTLVTVTGGRVDQVEQRDLDVLRWQECRVDLSGCSSQEDLFRLVRRHLEAARERGEGRTLAARLILTGSTVLHQWLQRRGLEWREECRNLAASLGEIWLEQVRLETQPEAEPEEVEEGSPLAVLVEEIRALRLSGDLCRRVPELLEFQTRLPPELLEGDTPFDLKNPRLLASLEEEVRGVLLARLLGREEGR